VQPTNYQVGHQGRNTPCQRWPAGKKRNHESDAGAYRSGERHHKSQTNTPKTVYRLDLDAIGEPDGVGLLRKVFTAPESLKPGQTTEKITEEVADLFAGLAGSICARGVPMERAAHFLMKLMFCMFAEDIDLLPKDAFTKTLDAGRRNPDRLARMLGDLFTKMAKGGEFGADIINFSLVICEPTADRSPFSDS
jgi:hypothetical protein